MISLHDWPNFYRICTQQGAIKVENVKNVWHFISRFVKLECTKLFANTPEFFWVDTFFRRNINVWASNSETIQCSKWILHWTSYSHSSTWWDWFKFTNVAFSYIVWFFGKFTLLKYAMDLRDKYSMRLQHHVLYH